MRVLFVTLAAKSHFAAQVPLAWALRAAGHEVRVASQPDLTEAVTAAGLTAVPVGDPLSQHISVQELRRRQERAAARLGDPPDAQLLMRLTETRPQVLTPDHLTGMVTVLTSAIFQNFSADRVVDDLVGFARSWRPDLVVWDTMMLAGAVAAQACGATHARLLYGLDLIGAIRARHVASLRDVEDELREDALAEWLSVTTARHGGRYDETLVTGDWTIDPIPASLRTPTDLPYLPMRYVPYNGRAVVPAWLSAAPARPRVCLTLGESFRETMGGDQSSIPDLLDALADLDVEVVATLTGDQLGGAPVPANVRVTDFVPLNDLLPGCALVVHQGGFGTGMTALAHGVPQVILPSDMWDAIPRAERVQSIGAGLTAGGAAAGPEQIREMVVRVLDDRRFRHGAQTVRREMLGSPAPAETVPVLRRLVADHRS